MFGNRDHGSVKCCALYALELTCRRFKINYVDWNLKVLFGNIDIYGSNDNFYHIILHRLSWCNFITTFLIFSDVIFDI